MIWQGRLIGVGMDRVRAKLQVIALLSCIAAIIVYKNDPEVGEISFPVSRVTIFLLRKKFEV